MKKENLYISTVDENAHVLARQYGLGLELAEYCTPWFLDREFESTDKLVREKLEGISEQWSLKTVWGVGYKFEVTDP